MYMSLLSAKWNREWCEMGGSREAYLSDLSTWESPASMAVDPQSFDDLGMSNDLDATEIATAK